MENPDNKRLSALGARLWALGSGSGLAAPIFVKEQVRLPLGSRGCR